MKKVEIPLAAVERNRVWINAVTKAIKQSEDSGFPRVVMREAGKQCAAQLRDKIIDHYGRTPQSVDEFIEAMNVRRKDELHASNLWERDGETAHFKLDTCGCDLVQAGLAEPNAIFCMCSAGMFEHLFGPFWHGTVRTEIIKSIGMGDEHCEFVVHFE
jgi:predicted hydrocarbon binding protein